MTYTDSKVIGEVTEVTGEAKIIRADGTEESITLGTEVFEGDIVETEGAGAVNIGFIDESEFAVSSDARVAIDEFVFDPASESGAQDFSVMKGVFMYTSGLIGRENPDSVEIDTPVGSIGIRGTIIGGDINPDGESQVTVIEGAIVVRNDGGEQLLSTQYDTVNLNSMNEAPSEVRTLDVTEVAESFGAVKDVSSGLFSSFDDQMKEQGPSDNLDESSVEETLEEIQEEKAAEEVPAEEIVEPVAAEEANKPKVELKMMEKSEEIKENIKENLTREEVREKIAEFKEANDIEDDINVNLLTTVDDIGLKFKVGGNVDENAPAATDIGHIVTTGDLPFTVTYSLTDDAGGMFAIDATTGVVTLTTAAPDFETTSQAFYNIRIQATRSDTGGTKEFNLRVNLKDVNESSEITAHTTAALGEDEAGLAADTVVSDLTFVEADTSKSAFRTQFTTDDARFEVQMNAGQLQLVAVAGAVFDYETDGSNIMVSITQNDGANTYSDYTVPVVISDLTDETPTNITESADTISEDAAVGDVVATLATTDADAGDTFTYSILSGNDDGIFSIVGDEIRVSDNTNLDFEDEDSYDLDVQVMDSAGNTYNKVITINIDDVNEPGIINVDDEDFGVDSNGDILGELKAGEFGATIGTLDIFDPEGDSYTAGDFNITGNAGGSGSTALSNFFEIVEDSGSFLLQLKDDYKIVSSGSFYAIADTSGPTGALLNPADNTMNIQLTGGNNISIEYDITDLAGNADATGSNDTFTIYSGNFDAIDGGAGHDLLKLDGRYQWGSSDLFDLRSMNTDPSSGDLKSIEEIKLHGDGSWGGLVQDINNTLKLDISQLNGLLSSSDNNILKISADTSGNKVEFYNGSTKEALTANGFTNHGDSDSDGFYEFTHGTLGTVLIEDTIIGAAGGGSV